MNDVVMTLTPADAAVALRELRRAARHQSGNADADRLRAIVTRLEAAIAESEQQERKELPRETVDA